MLIESFDALFGLPRKKSAETSVRPPLYGNKVLYFQEDVDKFIQSYPTRQWSLQKVTFKKWISACCTISLITNKKLIMIKLICKTKYFHFEITKCTICS